MIKLIIFIIAISYIIETNGDDEYTKNTVLKAQKALKTSKEAFTKVSEFIKKSPNIGKLFAKLGSALGALGPAAMAISAVLSIVTIFLPKEDSPELKAIKSGFEEVNNRLDILTSKIGNLDNIIELSSARAAYVKTVSTINNNFLSLQEAQKSKSKDDFKIFVEQYERSFEFSTANMYDIMTGATGVFGFNMVTLYKTHVKCNPILLSSFCTMGMQLINKGLSVEGAYLGYRNFTAKVQAKEETWKVKLNEVSTQCLAVIESCENSWKDYAMQQFEDSHKEMSGSNQEIANKLAKDLENVVPQRNWLAVAYGEAWGFGAHTYSSYYPVEKKWRERKHCVTIFSTEKKEALVGDDYNKLVQMVDAQKAISAAVNNCKMEAFWVILKDRYDDHARIVVNRIRDKYMTGVVYAIMLDLEPAHAITGGTVYVSEQKWQCASQNLKMIIYE